MNPNQTPLRLRSGGNVFEWDDITMGYWNGRHKFRFILELRVW